MRYRELLEKEIKAYHGTTADFDEFAPKNAIDYGESSFFHFGSNPHQANVRLSYKDTSGARILPVKLQIKHPLRMSDIGEWSPFDIITELCHSKNTKIALAANELYKTEYSREKTLSKTKLFAQAVRRYRKNHGLQYTGNFNSWPKDKGEMEFRKQYNKKYNEQERQMVIDLLHKLGYDSIVYKNEYEGMGDSYVIFNNNQIKPWFSN